MLAVGRVRRRLGHVASRASGLLPNIRESARKESALVATPRRGTMQSEAI